MNLAIDKRFEGNAHEIDERFEGYAHHECFCIALPGSLTRRKIWDTAGYKRVSRAFEGMRV